MIRSLNLDGMFVPKPAPEIEYNMKQFYGGEMHIRLNNNIDYSIIDRVIITNRFRTGDDNGVLKLKDQCTPEEEKMGLLTTVFKDGKIVRETSLSEIRERVAKAYKLVA